MIRTIDVKYNGVELMCKGYYSPYRNNGYDDPPEYECFEIDTIYYRNTDITELVDLFNFDLSELECLCIESLKD
jgi:hypothetical protein